MPHVIKENNATFNFLSANQQQTGILKTIVQKSSSCLPLMTETVRLFLWVDPPVDTQKCIMSGILSSTYWLVTVVSLWMEQHEWDASVLLIEFGSDVISALRTNTSHHKALAALSAKAWKVEGWVAQSCPTLRPHGLYSPWNSPDQNTGVGSHSLLQGIFPAQGSNPGLPHCGWILYQLSHEGTPKILEWVAYPFSSGSSRPRNRTLQAKSLPTELSGKPETFRKMIFVFRPPTPNLSEEEIRRNRPVSQFCWQQKFDSVDKSHPQKVKESDLRPKFQFRCFSDVS